MIEIEGYRVEILYPQGTCKYIVCNTVPCDYEVKAEYGLFARIGSIEPLMRVSQHKILLKDQISLSKQR